MKYSMSIVMTLLAGVACAQEPFILAPLTHEMVSAYQYKIERGMRRDYYIKKGAMAATVGLFAWCCYRVATAPSLPANVTPSVEPVVLASAPAFVSDKVITNEQIWEKLLELSKNNSEFKQVAMRNGISFGNETWIEWGKNNVRYYVDHAIIGVACTGLLALLNPLGKYYQKFDHALDTMIDTLFHDDSLAWFMQSKVANMPSLTLLETYAQKLDAVSLQNEQEREAWQSAAPLFVNSWHLFNKQMAALAGFMRYKGAVYAKRSVQHEQFMQQQTDMLLQVVEQEREHLLALLRQENSAHTFTQSVAVLQKGCNQALKEIALLESLLDY